MTGDIEAASPADSSAALQQNPDEIDAHYYKGVNCAAAAVICSGAINEMELVVQSQSPAWPSLKSNSATLLHSKRETSIGAPPGF